MKAPGNNIALFALVFLATLVVRFFALIFIWPNYISTATFPDEHNYYLSAASLINQSLSGFIRSDRLLWNGPLNPIWVAVLGGNVALIKSLNVVIFSAASALLGCFD